MFSLFYYYFLFSFFIIYIISLLIFIHLFSLFIHYFIFQLFIFNNYLNQNYFILLYFVFYFIIFFVFPIIHYYFSIKYSLQSFISIKSINKMNNPPINNPTHFYKITEQGVTLK